VLRRLTTAGAECKQKASKGPETLYYLQLIAERQGYDLADARPSQLPRGAYTVCLDSCVTRLISAILRPACLIWAIAARTSGVVLGHWPTYMP
jgi:hypothetical protein